MQHHISIQLMFACSLTACSDPCTWTWWGEKAANAYNEYCDDEGEEGETGSEFEYESLVDCDHETQRFCFNGDHEPVSFATDQMVPKYDCRAPSALFRCNGWWDGVVPDNCFLCRPATADPVPLSYFDLWLDPPPDNTGWGLCQRDPLSWDPDPLDGMVPATQFMWEDETSFYGIENIIPLLRGPWGAECPSCARNLVHIRRFGDDSIFHGDWTCECETDSDCSAIPGGVCEAGWQLVNFQYRPTLCTWDDGSGTSNGVAPEGPVVYDAADWSDVVVDGNRITVTSKFVAAAILGAGLWNDDQRFDFEIGATGETATATITRCGPDSLCAHLGWREGLVVEADVDIGESLAAGESVAVDVLVEDGAVEIWTIDVLDS